MQSDTDLTERDQAAEATMPTQPPDEKEPACLPRDINAFPSDGLVQIYEDAAKTSTEERAAMLGALGEALTASNKSNDAELINALRHKAQPKPDTREMIRDTIWALMESICSVSCPEQELRSLAITSGGGKHLADELRGPLLRALAIHKLYQDTFSEAIAAELFGLAAHANIQSSHGRLAIVDGELHIQPVGKKNCA